jgi:hypothetical protein
MINGFNRYHSWYVHKLFMWMDCRRTPFHAVVVCTYIQTDLCKSRRIVYLFYNTIYFLFHHLLFIYNSLPFAFHLVMFLTTFFFTFFLWKKFQNVPFFRWSKNKIWKWMALSLVFLLSEKPVGTSRYTVFPSKSIAKYIYRGKRQWRRFALSWFSLWCTLNQRTDSSTYSLSTE